MKAAVCTRIRREMENVLLHFSMQVQDVSRTLQ